MKRVVITGLGIVSCLGNDAQSVTTSLQNTKSGIRHDKDYAALGFRSQVSGRPDIILEDHIERKLRRFMGDAAGYAYVSLKQAIDDAGLPENRVIHPRTGIIMGSGGGSCQNIVEAADILRNKGVKRIGPYMVTRTMSSTVSACLSTAFHIKGVNYSISSACSTSAHCIGAAAEQIQWGKQDIVFAGGGEEVHWSMSNMFDAMGAMSSRYNETPEKASRAYDADRDGFVIAGGGGAIVLEEFEHARQRGAPIYAELMGYGATADGHDMVAPSGEGGARCMNIALQNCQAENIDYINAHGTSTVVGDISELHAIHQVLGDRVGAISSTKSLSGHSLGAAGVQEVIYCLLMMKHGFVTASANIEKLDDHAKTYPILRETSSKTPTWVMSNSFGFGGTNASLVLKKVS